VLIAINNLRDIHADKLVNKKTLAVRLGVGPAKVWICFLIMAPYLVGYYWLFQNKIYFYVAPMLSLPLGISVMKKVIRTEPSAQYNRFLAQSSAYAMLFSVLFFVGTRI
jgi:1,4-dihydroxy-2-naphthoate octaprenyltransferase